MITFNAFHSYQGGGDIIHGLSLFFFLFLNNVKNILSTAFHVSVQRIVLIICIYSHE